jgi:hypothetical protein
MQGGFCDGQRRKGLVVLKKLSVMTWKELFAYGEKIAAKMKIDRQQIVRAVRNSRHGRWSGSRAKPES